MVHDDDQSAKLSKLLEEWQQGDIIQIAGLPFIYLADLRNPSTPKSKEFAENDPQPIQESPFAAIAEAVNEFVIISQSCDIIKDHRKFPTLQIAPLKEVDSNTLGNAKRGSSASFLFLPTFEKESIVANLDHIMTVEKSVLLHVGKGPKKHAVRDDHERKTLGAAIARKFNRFAFPDEFNSALRRFQERVIGKTRKNSPEGLTYQSVAEIRVVPTDAWERPQMELTFLFFFEQEDAITTEAKKFAAELVGLFEVGGKYPAIPNFRCVTYRNVDADTYRRSFPLDLDYLSQRRQ